MLKHNLFILKKGGFMDEKISIQKMGGIARSKALTAEQRKEIALHSSHSRKCYDGIPKASHYGKLNIGDIEITCAVLEDGRSVITESSLFKLFGMRRGGRKKKIGGAQMPRFLSSNNLE